MAIGSTRSSAKYLETKIRLIAAAIQPKSPVYPVRDIKSSVCAERGKVMCRDGLRFASSLEHEQLGKDGDGL
jgi:hypothetical protein